MEPIDKILIRIGIVILGGLLGKNAYELQNVRDTISQIHHHTKTTYNAGLVPLPPPSSSERKK